MKANSNVGKVIPQALVSSTMSQGLSTITGSFGQTMAEQEAAFDQDINSTLKLFGREHETTLMLDAYHRVAENHGFEMVILHGESGTGKSALVDSLRGPVCSSKGYFCTGKYFQNDEVQEPYSAIMAAFSDLCDLVSQSDDFDEDRKRIIQNKLGCDGPLLAKSISNISPFLADSPGDKQSLSTRADADFRKFKGACRSFLYAMSSEEHPIVLFLDDVQWMDEGSRQLLFMLQQGDLVNLMLILTYREEESLNVREWMISNNHDGGKKVALTDINLKNLTVEAVNQLVANTLSVTDIEETLELSQLVSSKTGGNAFHVMEFVEALNRECLLLFNEETSTWDYNITTIQEEMMVHESLADLLAKKIQLLSPTVSRTLQIASVLGYAFEKEVLLEVCDSFESSWNSNDFDSDTSTVVTVSIGEALQMGFVEKTASGYQFAHDKLQAAFSSMYDNADLQELHGHIGKTFLSLDRVDSSYHAAVHLNQSSMYKNDETLRLKLAKINLSGAKYCIERSAFFDAAQFLHFGLGLLDPHLMWTENYELAFELTEKLSRVELACGNFIACEERVNEILLHASSAEMKMNSLLILVQCSLASNQVKNSADTAIHALMVCGVRLPRKVTIFQVLCKRMRVQVLMVGKHDDDILNLPDMQDRLIIIAVHLLFLIASTCLLEEKELLAVYAGLLAAELTLKFGLAPHSPCAFTVVGLLEVSLGKIERGYRFGKLALQLQDRLSCPDAESPTVVFSLLFLLHWKDPIRDHRAIMYRALESGYACGNIPYTVLCAALCNNIDFVLGEALQRSEQFMRFNYSRFSTFDDDGAILLLQPALQLVINMQNVGGHWAESTYLTGEIMDEDEFLKKVICENNKTFHMNALSCKSILSYYFGFYAKAVAIYEEMATISKAFRNSQSGLPYYLYGALSYYEHFRNTKKPSLFRKARRHFNSLKQMKSKVPNPNIDVFVALLDAVDSSVRKSATAVSVGSFFERAISSSSDENLVHMEAIANEVAGFVFANFGQLVDAERYFIRAQDLYLHEWGAMAKYEWLVEKSGAALAGLKGESVMKTLMEIIVDNGNDAIQAIDP